MELYPTKFNKDLKGRNLNFGVRICTVIYQKVNNKASYRLNLKINKFCKKHLFPSAFLGIRCDLIMHQVLLYFINNL